MVDIKVNEIDVLTKGGLSVLMIWADGCHVCDSAKPQFDILSENYTEFNFYKLQLNGDSMNFYKQHEEEVPVKKYILDSNGRPIADETGSYLHVFERDEMGEIIKRVPIAVPKYYVFHEEEVDIENPYGLLGKVDGHNLLQLESILENLSNHLQKDKENGSE